MKARNTHAVNLCLCAACLSIKVVFGQTRLAKYADRGRRYRPSIITLFGMMPGRVFMTATFRKSWSISGCIVIPKLQHRMRMIIELSAGHICLP
jgi:hypothetical protein